MKLEEKLEFPCGYKINQKLSVLSIFVSGKLGSDLHEECPLHGEDCEAPPRDGECRLESEASG